MAYEIKTKIWFYHLSNSKVGEVLIAFETEFRRDERVMRLTVSLDKHAISWLKEEEQIKIYKAYHGNITTICFEKKTEIFIFT
jgi:small subunit ribosomal protein S6